MFVNLDRQTHLIITSYDGKPYVAETPLGLSFLDAVEAVASGEHEHIEAVIEFNAAEGLSQDVTEDVCTVIGKRSFANETSPSSAARDLCDQCDVAYWIDPAERAEQDDWDRRFDDRVQAFCLSLQRLA
jgi:hypothetical protein